MSVTEVQAEIRPGEMTSAGRRPRLARACGRAGAMPLIGWVRAALRRDVRILAYHRVLETANPSRFRFDPELISASTDAFRQQVALIKRWVNLSPFLYCANWGQWLLHFYLPGARVLH